MRRRLYFVARVEDRHMHFLARRGTDLGGLHEAGYLMKNDARHGAGLGLGLGVLAVERIGQTVLARHPEAVPAGQARPYPVFP